MFKQLDLIKELYPLHRTLVSDDIDLTLEIIKKYLPSNMQNDFEIVKVASGTKCWTWDVPKKYIVHKAYIALEDGTKIIDFNDNNLHLVSYSKAIDATMNFERLDEHLFYTKKRPDAIPWKFYYYIDDWGFCLPYNQYKKLDKKKKYKVVIDVEFVDEYLKIGELKIAGKNSAELLIISNICHPYQVNDSITGVSATIDALYNLDVNNLENSLRVLFLPETIGSISYFASDESRADNIKHGIFSEMLGNDYSLALQHSFEKETLIDDIAVYVLSRSCQKYRTGLFREIVGNDELVTNGPGLRIPTISISRSKITLDSFPEYHTSDDTPDRLIEEKLEEAKNVLTQVIRIYLANYTPKRLFKGPIFLSGFDLWGVWGDLENGKEYVDQIMFRLEGDKSVFEIAKEIGLEFERVKEIIDKFYEKKLVEKVQQ
jgi:aminopeptidase-like protein